MVVIACFRFYSITCLISHCLVLLSAFDGFLGLDPPFLTSTSGSDDFDLLDIFSELWSRNMLSEGKQAQINPIEVSAALWSGQHF